MLYRVNVNVCATAYIKADTPAQAIKKARALNLLCLEVQDAGQSEIEISGVRFEDPRLPDVSLSPAMTCLGPSGDQPEPVEDVPDYEAAARKAGWTHGGDGDGIIWHQDHYDSWKAAMSWSPQYGPIYDTWQECCEAEGIEVE